MSRSDEMAVSKPAFNAEKEHILGFAQIAPSCIFTRKRCKTVGLYPSPCKLLTPLTITRFFFPLKQVCTTLLHEEQATIQQGIQFFFAHPPVIH
eukprot:scaffold47438_cov22-Tisochrysis_lutea.AAC.2